MAGEFLPQRVLVGERGRPELSSLGGYLSSVNRYPGSGNGRRVPRLSGDNEGAVILTEAEFHLLLGTQSLMRTAPPGLDLGREDTRILRGARWACFVCLAHAQVCPNGETRWGQTEEGNGRIISAQADSYCPC